MKSSVQQTTHRFVTESQAAVSYTFKHPPEVFGIPRAKIYFTRPKASVIVAWQAVVAKLDTARKEQADTAELTQEQIAELFDVLRGRVLASAYAETTAETVSDEQTQQPENQIDPDFVYFCEQVRKIDSGVNLAHIDFEAMFRIVSALSGFPESAVKEFDLTDFMAIVEVVVPLFLGAQK